MCIKRQLTILEPSTWVCTTFLDGYFLPNCWGTFKLSGVSLNFSSFINTITGFESIVTLSPKERGRELEREPCRNTDTTSHGEHTDPTGIPSCLIFCSAPDPTLTTFWTHQHTTPWSLNINNLLKRRSTYRITECRSLCLTSNQLTRNRFMSDPQCTSSWIQ